MIRSWVSVALLAFTGFAPEQRCPHNACRCIPVEATGQTLTEFVRAQRDRAERVVLGRVTSVDTLPAESWGAGHDAVTLRPIVARIRVDQSWRGPRTDTMTVMWTTLESRSSCDLELRHGERYIIFAARTEGGPLATYQCSGTAEARNAAATLTALGPGQRARP